MSGNKGDAQLQVRRWWGAQAQAWQESSGSDHPVRRQNRGQFSYRTGCSRERAIRVDPRDFE